MSLKMVWHTLKFRLKDNHEKYTIIILPTNKLYNGCEMKRTNDDRPSNEVSPESFS